MTSTANIRSIISHGTDGLPVEIECHIANSLPSIVIVGAANRNVDEAKERIRGAFTTAGLQLPRKRISINLAPADIPKDSSSLDMPIAMAILQSAGMLSESPAGNEAFIGELGLDGQVRPVRGIIGKLLCGRRQGFSRFYIPSANLQQALIVPGLEIIAVDSLRQLHGHFNSLKRIACTKTGEGILPKPDAGVWQQPNTAAGIVHTSDIVGQSLAKRALAIAAAGGHNLLLNGPPGTGKSMLAKALVQLLPELSHEEMLEVTQLHSLSSYDYERPMTERPFRAPHHSASHAAIVGGGSAIRPGEVSLAHRGVLFFDELPEFGRPTIETLRQPLEDRSITISRAKESITYPANFIFVATANPCPCGYFGTSHITGKLCTCPRSAVINYRSKLSGPLLDRIDIRISVDKVEHSNLLSRTTDDAEEASIIKLVLKARSAQAQRFGNRHFLNSDMSNRDIRDFAYPDPEGKDILDQAGKQHRLSARSYMRCLRVARTLADMAGSEVVGARHIGEALQFRA